MNLGGFCRSQSGLTRAAAWQCRRAHGPQRYSVFCWELKWIFIFSCNKPMLMGLLLEKQFLNFICLLQQNAPLLRAWPCALLFTSIYFGYLDSHWKIRNQHWPKSLLSFLDFTCTHPHRCESKHSRCVSAWCTLTSFPPGGGFRLTPLSVTYVAVHASDGEQWGSAAGLRTSSV